MQVLLRSTHLLIFDLRVLYTLSAPPPQDADADDDMDAVRNRSNSPEPRNGYDSSYEDDGSGDAIVGTCK